MKSLKPSLVNALILNSNEHALVVHNCKQYEGYENNRWEFPGGKVKENDKTLESAIVRKIKEELGVKIKIIKIDGSKILGDYETQTPEGCFNCRTYFARIVDGDLKVMKPWLRTYDYFNYSRLLHLNNQGILAPNLSLGLAKLRSYIR